MKLITKILKIFSFIFVAQLIVVSFWALTLYSSTEVQFPSSVITSLTKIDKSIIEGIILQNKIGSSLSRDLIAYRLLETNNLDSAEFLKSSTLTSLITRLNLKNCFAKDDITICSKPDNKVVLSLVPLKIGDTLEGFLKLEKSLKLVEEVNKKILVTIGITIFTVFVINIFTLLMIWSKFLKPETKRLTGVFENEKEDPAIQINEYKKIQNLFLNAISRVKMGESEKADLISQLKRMDLARQVSHDIRSPLAALNMVSSDLKEIPEDKRLLIRNAIQRINDIANDLLAQGKKASELNNISSNNNEVLLLPALVDSLVSEKRIQFRDKINVRIELDLKNSFGAFILGDGKELMRLLSNLINNSVEALRDNKGEVNITVTTFKEKIQIAIKDNGIGIPAEVLKKLGTKGITFGKEKTESGTGLGIYHAKKSIENFGGSLILTSQLGEGTAAEINLPRTKIPNWFLKSIDLKFGMEIVCLDDDLSIHQVWKSRIDNFNTEQQVALVHSFTSANEFKQFVKDLTTQQCNAFFLVDYELLGQSTNGLDVIKELGIYDNVALVTSRYEDPEIRQECELLKIKLLPKSLAELVPIEVLKPRKYYDAILIDDDELIHILWQMNAKKKIKEFISFYSMDDFLKQASHFDLDSPVYIDSNLKNGVRGEEVSILAFEMGFKNISICTGYEASNFPEMAHIKMVIGKEPCF